MLGKVYDEPMSDNYDDIQNLYNDYKSIYNQMTKKEILLSFQYPSLAFSIKENRRKAFEATSHLDGERNGFGDAVRHCYWCALNQISAGLNSPLAKKFGDANESSSDNNVNERNMDLHNNSVDYYLGNQAIIYGWSESTLFKHVINAAYDGKLQIIK